RKRAYCLKIQPATGSFARNLIYSTKPRGSAELLPFLYDGGPLSDPGARLGARRHLILPPGGGNNCFHE
ncbi:hypothetical protein WCV48_18505, partial [Klebsiella pneumoniae]|uniref:hypothetical protein n=1 Tax=Klebsiella pneumoniae TaxID=573 RepID=UPI003015DB46